MLTGPPFDTVVFAGRVRHVLVRDFRFCGIAVEPSLPSDDATFWYKPHHT
jgi:hypothetical protein